MDTKTRTILVSVLMAFLLTIIYTNLSYWLSDVAWIVPNVIAWNWNDFMVMILVSTGITTSMAVLLTNLLKKTDSRKGKRAKK